MGAAYSTELRPHKQELMAMYGLWTVDALLDSQGLVLSDYHACAVNTHLDSGNDASKDREID